MATAEQRSRRAAQRATAKRVREARQTHQRYRRILPKSFSGPARQRQIDYANAVLRGDEPRPAKGTAEGRQLARMAAFAAVGKAPVGFKVFEDYFYHKKGLEESYVESEEDDEDYDEDDDEE